MSEENKKTPVNLSRRRLAKAALVAAPVLAVLPGKPAMALYKKNNCTVSGNLSGNMSDAAVADDQCSVPVGKTPSTLMLEDNPWPLGVSKLEQFNNIFGGEVTLSLEIILGGGDADLKAQAVASYINSLVIPGYGMSDDDVVESYADHHQSDEAALLLTYQYLNGMIW